MVGCGRLGAASKSFRAPVSPQRSVISIFGAFRAEGGLDMKSRLQAMRLCLVAMVVVAVVAGLAGSARAAPGAAAGLSVRSTEYGKALFGPSGKVVYVF